MRSLPGRAGLSRSDVRGARWDAIDTATADGTQLSKKEKNGLLTLCGNRDGGTRSRNPRLAKKRGFIRRASWLRCRRRWAARALVQWLRFEWQRAG